MAQTATKRQHASRSDFRKKYSKFWIFKNTLFIFILLFYFFIFFWGGGEEF